MLTNERLEKLLASEDPTDKERAAGELTGLLTSPDLEVREQGYAFLRKALEVTVCQSCLHYRALVGDFTEPVVQTISRTVEAWAASAARAADHQSGEE